MSEDLYGRQTLPACDGWPAGYFYRMKEAAIMAEVDPKLLEMAEVFHIPKKARLKYIILPAKMPGLSKLFNKKNPADNAGTQKGQKGGSHR